MCLCRRDGRLLSEAMTGPSVSASGVLRVDGLCLYFAAVSAVWFWSSKIVFLSSLILVSHANTKFHALFFFIKNNDKKKGKKVDDTM